MKRVVALFTVWGIVIVAFLSWPIHRPPCKGCRSVGTCVTGSISAYVLKQCTSGRSVDNPVVSIITSVFAGDLVYLHSFVANVKNQVVKDCEIFFVTSQRHVFVALELALSDVSSVQVTRVLLHTDPGLYEIWDLIAHDFVRSPFVTNWNLDDAKHPFALQRILEVFRTHESIDVVAPESLLTETPFQIWSPQSHPVGKRIYGQAEGFVALADLYCGASRPRNVPHSGPVWRTSLHRELRGFSRGYQAVLLGGKAVACSDWTFWVSVLLSGRRIWFIQTPLELYFYRKTSLGNVQQNSCVKTASIFMSQLGLYNGQCDGRKLCQLRVMLQVCNSPPLLLVWLHSLSRWLKWNRHVVDFASMFEPQTKAYTYDVILRVGCRRAEPTNASRAVAVELRGNNVHMSDKYSGFKLSATACLAPISQMQFDRRKRGQALHILLTKDVLGVWNTITGLLNFTFEVSGVDVWVERSEKNSTVSMDNLQDAIHSRTIAFSNNLSVVTECMQQFVPVVTTLSDAKHFTSFKHLLFFAKTREGLVSSIREASRLLEKGQNIFLRLQPNETLASFANPKLLSLFACKK